MASSHCIWVEAAEDFVVANAWSVVVASAVDVVAVAAASASSSGGSFETSCEGGVPWDPSRCWAPFPFGWVASFASVACVAAASSFVAAAHAVAAVVVVGT